MIKRYLFFILIVCLFAVSAVSGAEIGNDTNMMANSDDSGLMAESVNEDVLTVSLNEEEIQGSADNGTFTVLQKKIDDASEGAIINLENNYTYDSEFLTRGISIDKKLTINGNGYTLDGNHVARIFYITSDVELNNINFINAFDYNDVTFYASVIYHDGGQLTIYDCNFVNNFGGPIYSNNVLTINDCNFVNNTATEEFFGCGAISSNGALTINDCNFMNNSGLEYGAIYSNGDLTINDCNFVNNTAKGELNVGGAICSNGALTINNCSFVNNSGRAGAVYTQEISIISDCNFINNTGGFGGAIFSDANLTINDSNFVNNSGEYCGIIYSRTNLTINNCNFTDNSPIGYMSEASGIISYGDSLIANDCNFLNTGLRYNPPFGAIYFRGDFLTVNDCNFVNNSANYGGAIYVSARGGISKSTISGKFIDNGVTSAGGAIFMHNCDYSSISGEFINNTAPYKSGAIHIINCNSSYINGEFINNSVCSFDIFYGNDYFAGGVIGIENVNESSISGKFINNHISCSGVYESPVILHGGAINIENVNESSISGEFINNYISCTAYSESGIIVYGDAIYSNSSFVLSDSIFIRNTNGGKERTYRNVSKSVLKDKNVVVCTEDYNVLRCTLIEKGEPTNVSAPDVTKYYGGDERFVVTVTDNAGKAIANEPVKVTINGQVYDRKTGADGRTTFAINLRSGTHEATTEHDGDVIKSTITVKTTVMSKDITKIFRNGTNYEASFLNSKGNKAPAGEKVSININGVFYQRTIKSDGSISFALNLEQGTYVLTLTNPYTGEEISNTVKILPNIVENKDLVKYYRNGSQFTFKLLDDKGNPVAGQKASININGVFYKRTTNENGVATFQINLGHGTYVLTLEYKGCRVSNTVTVLSVIQSSDIKMKYQDGTRFKVTILDGVGKPYSNQSVTFNINGVFYYRVTGTDGSASLAINLMAGEYIITTTYNSLNVSNKVTIANSNINSNSNTNVANLKSPEEQYFDILGPNGANGYVYYPDGTYEHFVDDIVVDATHNVYKI